jgi:hypothetical protein
MAGEAGFGLLRPRFDVLSERRQRRTGNRAKQKGRPQAACYR